LKLERTRAREEKAAGDGSTKVSQNTKEVTIVTTLLLLEPARHKTSLVALKGAIRASLYLVHPLASDRSDMRWQRNKIPGASTLQGSNLLSHSMLLLWVSSSLPIGLGLSQNGSSEAKAIWTTKCAAVMKSIARGRLRRRSKDGRGRVKWRRRSRTTSVVVSDLT
jgi:hypothetical protein